MMRLYDFLRAGHVKRWHIVNTATTQSIAEHSYLVAIIAMHLCDEFGGAMEECAETAIWALYHDAVEIRTGDIPTPAKRLIRGIDGGAAVLEQLDRELMPRAPFIPNGMPNDIADKCVRLADAIEAAHWIKENGLGRHAEIVYAGCWRRVEDLVSHYECYDQVNVVLMALGMPYISKEERITPP